MSTHNILIGAHVSIAKNLHLAFARGESIGCTALQIFTKSSRSLFGKPLQPDEVSQFKATHKKSSITTIIAHAGYLINLCSKNTQTEHQSIAALEHELDRCAQLNIPHLVLHPGAHLGVGEEKGIEKIAANLDAVLEKTNANVMVLLETTAGQGTTLGTTFEQLKIIRNTCSQKKRIGICLDTCHIFCAGYDISTKESYRKTLDHFDKVIGFSHLKAIHLNDSFGDKGSRIDRHAPLGEGKIPWQTFELIMNDKDLINIPKILETPADETMALWKKEIESLKKVVA